MVGQENLLKQLDKIQNIEDLPKSIIIAGSKGMGKHTFADTLAQKFGVWYEDIDYELSLDLLNDMYNTNIIKFYLSDLEELCKHKRLERFENTLLKFLEEPPELAWIVLLVPSEEVVLETIRNRCQIFKLEPYSREELELLVKLYNRDLRDEDLDFLSTPGEIMTLDHNHIQTLVNLGNTIITKIGNTTPANVISISNRFFGKENLNLDIFLNIFCKELFTCYIWSEYNQKYSDAFFLTKNFIEELKIMNVNRQYVFERFLLRLKSALR